MLALRLAPALLATGCILPVLIPASRIDGGTSLGGHPDVRIGTHLVGYRLDRDATWDVGAGYIPIAQAGSMPSTASGFYVESSLLHRIDSSTRVSFGPGLSVLFPSDHDVVPMVYLRAGIELFTSGKGEGSSSDGCGTAAGSWYGQSAIGAYVDVQKPTTETGVSVIAGLTVRLPTMAAIVVGIPHCRS